MAQHTPGPYVAEKRGSFGWAIMADWHGEQSKIAFVDAGICEIKGKFFDENAANARLIAAAPDLLEALRSVTERLSRIFPATHDWREVTQARAAIARARGEG